MSDFKSLNEIMDKVTAVLVIDLASHAMMLDEQLHLAALEEPIQGIYLTGSIDPFISLDNKYYLRSKYNLLQQQIHQQSITPEAGKIKYTQRQYCITNVDDIFNLTEDLVDSDGTTVITPTDIKRKRKYMFDKPTVPAVGIKLASIVGLRYLSTMCPYTKNKNSVYRIDSLVKKEYHPELYKKEYEFQVALHDLVDEIMKFIGDDTWHIYFHKIKGTALIIEKTIDWRIYEYYRMKFEEDEKLSSKY